jgi:hypothetical protein
MISMLTLRDVPCMMYDDLHRGQHFLHGELHYDITNPQYHSEGYFSFQLWDEEGWIADYVILNRNIDLIELYDQNGNILTPEHFLIETIVLPSTDNL